MVSLSVYGRLALHVAGNNSGVVKGSHMTLCCVQICSNFSHLGVISTGKKQYIDNTCYGTGLGHRLITRIHQTLLYHVCRKSYTRKGNDRCVLAC